MKKINIRHSREFFPSTTKENPSKVKHYLNSEHVWIENDTGYIDIFANGSSNHNGPVCSVCGYDKCWHCGGLPPKKCGRREG